MTITSQSFKQIFTNKPELFNQSLMTKREAYNKAAKLFKPLTAVEIMSDFQSLLPENKSGYVSSISELFTDGFDHYGLRQMIAEVQ